MSALHYLLVYNFDLTRKKGKDFDFVLDKKIVSRTLFIVKPPFFLLIIVQFNHVKFRMFDVFHYDFGVTTIRPIINQSSRPTSEKKNCYFDLCKVSYEVQ